MEDNDHTDGEPVQQFTIVGPRISHKVTIIGPDNEKLVFQITVPLSESRSASYDPYNIVHLPTALYAYRSTSARRWSVSGRLVSRTPAEARENAYYVDLVRKWLLPEFGTTGATPPILRIYGYHNENIDGRPVILTQYEWAFADDVDYISVPGEQAMPIIGSLTLNFDEIYSAEEITSGAWRMTQSSRGNFTGGGDDEVNSLVISNFTRSQQQGVRDLSASSITSVASALEAVNGVKPTIAGVVAGSLTRSIGTQILNSNKVQEITRQLPPVVKNIFVSGANVLIQQAGSIVTNSVSISSQIPTEQQLTSKQFSRSTELPPPSFTDPND